MERKQSLVVWICCAILITLMLIGFIIISKDFSATKTNLDKTNDILILLFAIISAVMSALIISHQPKNLIGWLLGTFPITYSLLTPFQQFLPSPGADLSQLSVITLVVVWLTGWSWWLIMGPILLIPLFFPTGRLLSPRWRWVVIGLVLEFAIFLFFLTFYPTFQIGTWATIQNPLGLLPEEVANLLLIPFQILLALLSAICVAAIFIRYHRANVVEKEQIKWLFYVFGIFLVNYLPGFFVQDLGWWGILLDISFLSIPIAIGVSILRYRLWDIDILIRRTITYGILSIALGISYYGSVVLLQFIFDQLHKNNSQVVIVFSTLLIAALFNPMHRKVKATIDHRFYRTKYDSALALEEFSSIARQEVELNHLTGRLVGVVEQTIQPDGVWLWIRK